MTDKPTLVLKDAVIHNGMITGVTEGGQNVTRRVLHHEDETVEVSDFIFKLEHKTSLVEKAKELQEDKPVDDNPTVAKDPS